MWRPSPRFPHYEAREDGAIPHAATGRVRSVNCASGYPRLTLSVRGRGVSLRVHQAVAEALLGPRPSRRHPVCHDDGNPMNSNLTNLRWDTYCANVMDRHAHGTMIRQARGEGHYRAKLSLARVAAARQMEADGMTRQEIARRFGVSKATITGALNGRTWRPV